jgi:hypothetical protein
LRPQDLIFTCQFWNLTLRPLWSLSPLSDPFLHLALLSSPKACHTPTFISTHRELKTLLQMGSSRTIMMESDFMILPQQSVFFLSFFFISFYYLYTSYKADNKNMRTSSLRQHTWYPTENTCWLSNYTQTLLTRYYWFCHSWKNCYHINIIILEKEHLSILYNVSYQCLR